MEDPEALQKINFLHTFHPTTRLQTYEIKLCILMKRLKDFILSWIKKLPRMGYLGKLFINFVTLQGMRFCILEFPC